MAISCEQLQAFTLKMYLPLRLLLLAIIYLIISKHYDSLVTLLQVDIPSVSQIFKIFATFPASALGVSLLPASRPPSLPYFLLLLLTKGVKLSDKELASTDIFKSKFITKEFLPLYFSVDILTVSKLSFLACILKEEKSRIPNSCMLTIFADSCY